MPKSKKPRHPHRNKPGRDYTKLRPEDLSWLHDRFSSIELKVELTLPRGECTDTDLFMIRDYVNWGITAVAVRTWYTDETRQQVYEMLQAAAIKVVDLQVRGRKNGMRFVCTADELSSIRKAFDFLGDFMNKSLHECPALTIREWNAMLRCSANAKLGQPVEIATKDLIAAVKRS